ncbi:MAG: hypothetical protein CBC38_00220 [Gammaproteobacteria bacterium TMED78]|nr:MAG: hypothetical protein CBC38_00220 [Gammaproteobacteria bacterium TMED78]|tara:strand:- start:369 stop:1124 length:756 start_codon:yes stop_codon:yes gene_type:complete
MIISKTFKILITILGCLFFSLTASSHLASGFDEALASADRPAEEKARDANRKPKEVLEFLRLHAGSTVFEVIAGAGWYTEVLSAAVGSEGRVISQIPGRFADRLGPGANERAERLGNVDVYIGNTNESGLDEEADFAFTALNFHDLTNGGDEVALNNLSAIYQALKPGGTLGIVDHIGNETQDNESALQTQSTLHRMEVGRALRLLSLAGFAVEENYEILHNPLDDHTLRNNDPSLERNTDRMVLRARKPD